MAKPFERNAAIVTGGAIRLGRAISLENDKKGYDVAIIYHSSSDEAEKTASEIHKLEVHCELFQADLRQVDTLPALFSHIIEKLPNLRVLINNASHFKSGPISKTDDAFLQEMFAIHLNAPFALTREFARHGCKGNIINLLDTKITANDYDYAAYYLAKKALAEFTKMAALEFAPDIRVNAVAPGPTIPTAGTGMTEFDEETIAAIPLKRSATTKNVTQAILHLLENDFINGHILTIDGGESLNSGSGLIQSRIPD